MSNGQPPPRHPAAGPELQPLEALALIAIATLISVTGVLWATGEISGRIVGGQWPHTGATEMGTVITRFASNLRDPAQAWPAAARSLIPAAAWFYATMTLLLVPAAATGGMIIRSRAARRARQPRSARWARPQDLSPLRVRGPEPGRLSLGVAHGKLLAAEPRQSVIVIGPVQTGKTTGLAIPAILEWQGPVVATSVKTDLMRDTHAARSNRDGGKVWVYDPTGGTGYPTAGWTPLNGCATWQGSQRVAASLVGSAHHGAGAMENAEFWYAAAAKLLAPVLHAAAITDQTMADVVRWIDTQEEEEVRWGLETADDPASLTAFDATCLRDERTRSGVYTTTETILAAYADPGVLKSAITADLQANRLLDGGPHTAYLCGAAHEQRRLQPLFATLVQEIVAAAYQRATETGEPLDPPLLLVLDECANIAPLRDLATLASTGAGQGIQLVTVFQDMAQIFAVYGRDRAPTIVTNHRAKIVLSGIADTPTLDYVGRLLGDQEIQHISSTSGAEGRHSKTESVAYRALAPANALREMKPGEGLLIYGNLPPARLKLRPWFKDRRLRKQAARNTPFTTDATRTAKARWRP